MIPEKRPLALTVLAIVAFFLSFPTVISALDMISVPHPPGSGSSSKELIYVYPGRAVQIGLGLLILVRVALQVTAGVGFLKQSERWGRRVANIWGGLTLVQLALSYVLLQIQPTPLYIQSLVIAVGAVGVTLTLINGHYRRAFR